MGYFRPQLKVALSRVETEEVERRGKVLVCSESPADRVCVGRERSG